MYCYFARHDPQEGEHAYPIVITGQSNTTRVEVSAEELLVTVIDEERAVVDSFSIGAKQR